MRKERFEGQPRWTEHFYKFVEDAEYDFSVGDTYFIAVHGTDAEKFPELKGSFERCDYVAITETPTDAGDVLLDVCLMDYSTANSIKEEEESTFDNFMGSWIY